MGKDFFTVELHLNLNWGVNIISKQVHTLICHFREGTGFYCVVNK